MKHLLKTMSGYQRSYLRQDILSGIVIAAASIPISMGYAQIAGLPAVYGLYGSLLPVIIFALFSTSPQFIFGVDAAPAAMTGTILMGMGYTLGSPGSAAVVPVLTFYTGLWLLLFTFLKSEKALNFISVPVMGGFLSGICCTIILMQVPKLMGHSSASGELLREQLEHLAVAFQDIHILSLVLGLSALAILLLSKKLFPRFPMAIVIMVAGAAATPLFDLESKGVACLSMVPSGLSPFQMPDLTLLSPAEGLGSSLSVAVVIMAETLLSEHSFALRDNYELNDNRELLSFSLANLVASFVGCCPVNGSVARTSINEQFGGHTQLVSLVSAAGIAGVLLFLTDFIHYLPVPILTAIVIASLLSVTEFDVAHRLFNANRKEFFIFVGAFLGVMVLGTIYGVVIGILLSFADVILRATQPRRDYMGVLPDHPGFYPLGRMSDARPLDHVVLYRFSGSLFFANIALFQRDIEEGITNSTKAVIVDGSGIVSVDISAADHLLALYRKLKDRNIKFYLTEHIGEVNDELRRFGAGELIQEGAVRRTLYAALMDSGAAEEHIQRLIPSALLNTVPELLRQTQEFEWAYGEDAEQQMEQLADQMIDSLEQTNSPERAQELTQLLYHGRWSGEIDQDVVLAHLEEHLAELSRLLERPEDKVLFQLEQERERIAEKLKQEHPEISVYLAERREELAQHLRQRYPDAAQHLEEIRSKLHC